MSQADVTEIIDVVDGTTDSLADSPEAQQVAADLPADALSFTYVNGSAILGALGEPTVQKLQAMTSPAEQAVWQAHTGLAIGAVESGFRMDAVVVPGARRRSWIGGHRQRSGHRGRRGASSGRHVPVPGRRGSGERLRRRRLHAGTGRQR